MKTIRFFLLPICSLIVNLVAVAQDDVTQTYIKNADFSSLQGWDYGDNGYNYETWRTDGEVPIVSFYHTWAPSANAGTAIGSTRNFHFSQEVKLPAGHYRLVVCGYYREGMGNGTNTKAYIFAGDNTKNLIGLNSYHDLDNYTGNDDYQKASDAFSKGDFANEVDFEINVERSITLGFRGYIDTYCSWCVMGPMKLYRISDQGEAYTVLNGTTLTFYFDNCKSSRLGTKFELNSIDEKPQWYSSRYSVRNVIFDYSFSQARPISTYYWFGDLTNLSSIEGLQYLNTSMVTNMRDMFKSCGYLTSLDISNFDTSNVTDMGSMFLWCKGLISLDLSKFDTSKVTDMSSMFSECSSLKNLDVSKFDTSNVTNMRDLFFGCRGLTSLDVSNFNTSKVTDMSSLFSGCSSLKNLDVSKFDTSKVTDMSSMFSECSSLKNLDVSKFDTSNVTDMRGLFFGCRGLTSLDVSNFDTSNVTLLESMFFDCSNLTNLDLSNFDTSNVTNMSWMFFDCNNLTNLNLTNFDTSNVINMEALFYNCSNLPELIVSNFNTSKVENLGWMFSGCANLVNLDVSDFDTSNVTNMAGMFESCNNLRNIDVSNFITSNVNNMESMFYGCKKMSKIKVSNFETSNVTDMGWMFAECSKLAILDVSNFDTSNTCRMSGMFSGCVDLKEIDVSQFNTSQVTQMCDEMIESGMFYNCSNLEFIDVSNFDTSHVEDMGGMFFGCSSLKNLDVSNFDTSNVYDMGSMFYGCSSLQFLDVSNFNTSNVYDMSNMFSGCSSLTILNVSNFDITNVYDMNRMFFNCSKLKSLDLRNFDVSNIGDIWLYLDDEDNWFEALANYQFLYGCSSLKELYISSSMNNIHSDAFGKVGTLISPCTIIAPDGFDFGVDTSGNYFQWKGGYFTLQQQLSLLGDVNNDGELSLADAVCIISWLLEQEPPVFKEELADFNEDGNITNSDAVAIILYLLDGGAANAPMARAKSEVGNKVVGYETSREGFDLQMGTLHDYTAMMMDVTLPEGETLQEVTLDGGHSLAFRALGEGRYRIAAWSMGMESLRDGAVLHCTTSSGHAGRVVVDNLRLVDMDTHEFGAKAVSCEPTGISEVTAGEAGEFYHTLGGVRVARPGHGVYVTKGRKVVK